MRNRLRCHVSSKVRIGPQHGGDSGCQTYWISSDGQHTMAKNRRPQVLISKKNFLQHISPMPGRHQLYCCPGVRRRQQHVRSMHTHHTMAGCIPLTPRPLAHSLRLWSSQVRDPPRQATRLRNTSNCKIDVRTLLSERLRKLDHAPLLVLSPCNESALDQSRQPCQAPATGRHRPQPIVTPDKGNCWAARCRV